MSSHNFIPFEKEDIKLLHSWLLDETIFKNLYILYKPFTFDELQHWYEDEKANHDAHIFKLIENHMIKGLGMIHHIHPKNKCAEISLLINPIDQNMGLGSSMLSYLLHYGFHILNLNKIFCHTADFNDSMKNLLEKAAFQQEGVYRKELFYHGEYHDIFRFGILYPEYKSQLRE